MKKSFFYPFSIILLLGFSMIKSHHVDASPHAGVNFQVFYNELSPYGDWVMDPNHGYVWVPFVESGFQPYASNGYWEMTNFGNTWVSNYAWGWAPFHYGRWFFTNYYGWAWVPGYEWGPAWVNWRTGGGYYGWAPLGPGFGINVSFYAPMSHWVFVSQRRFRHRNFHSYFVPYYQVANIYNRTTVINNTYVYNNQTYISGPSRREVERVTRSRVPVYQVNDSARPGRSVVHNNRLNVYRPQISENRAANQTARPSRVYSAAEYNQRSVNHTRSDRSTGTKSVQATSPSRSSISGSRSNGQNVSGNQSPNRPSVNSANQSRNPHVGTAHGSRSNANTNMRATQSKASSSGTVQRPAVNSRGNREVNQRATTTNPSVNRQARPVNQQRSQPSVQTNTPSRQNQPTARPQSNPSKSAGNTVTRSNSSSNPRPSSTSRGSTRGGN